MKNHADTLLILAVIVVGLFILVLLGDFMYNKIEVINADRQSLVVVQLDRNYQHQPKSKAMKDALRKLEEEIQTQQRLERSH